MQPQEQNSPLVSELRRFFGLDDAALARVRENASVLGALATRFHDYLLGHAETAAVFAAMPPQRMQTIVEHLAGHYSAMLHDWPARAPRATIEIARVYYTHGVSPTWIAGSYKLYREHLETHLAAVPSTAREILRQSVHKLLSCDLMLQLAALDEVHSEAFTERNVITQTLLETTIKLANLPSLEAVFSSICTDLVAHSRHLPGVWFTLLEDERTPLRPVFGAGADALWRQLEAPYAADDPLWRAIESNRGQIIDLHKGDPQPRWWPHDRRVEAAAIIPFGHRSGLRGLGVVYADRSWYFDHVDLASFTAFAHLGQALLGMRENQLRDPLTGLPNRTLFTDRLQQALQQAERRQRLLGIGMLDLDGFKEINERLGHLSGDELLHQVADRLASQLRQGDTLARLGGDEFGLLLTDLGDVDEAENILKRMLEGLEKPFTINRENVSIGASFGLTLYPLDETGKQDLLRHADTALYQAKDAGRHTYRIFEYARAEKRRQLDNLRLQLENALNSNAIEFHYQPKVDLALGRVVGVEALARWRRDDTLILPAHFIGVVESSPHLSRRLGRHALFAAARQIEQWREQGLPIDIAVNIGVEHLLDAAFVDDIDEVLDRHPGAADHLELEVTERAALSDLIRTRAALQACRDRGLSIALDDYGTGHASLTYLQELPVNQIKLDQRFVQKLLDEPRALAIIAGNLTSANLLELSVVAEGVETLEQGELLLQLGCRQAQGFLIARPMPATQLANWLTHWRPPQEWSQWEDNLFTQQDLPFLMARTWHRHNLQTILQALQTPPTPEHPFLQVPECVDETHCALGCWLRGAGQRHRHLPAFASLVQLHSETHAQAIKTSLAWQTADAEALAREADQLRGTAHTMDRQILELAREIGLPSTRRRSRA